jgi:hypothetical protein
MNKEERNFETWYRSNERNFHCGQLDEKQIAYGAFIYGLLIGNEKENPMKKLLEDSKPMEGKELEILKKTASRLISQTPTKLGTEKSENPILKNIIEFSNIPENIRFLGQIDRFTLFFKKNFSMITIGNPLIINVIEGDCLEIEWIFPDFRFGFSIEKIIQESNWYFVSKKKYGETTVSALIDDEFGEELLWTIIDNVS